jgi:hypothetical protein
VETVVLGIVALSSVVLAFGFASFALVMLSRTTNPEKGQPSTTEPSFFEHGGATETLSRVVADVERLALLRAQGALTDKEFATQKGRLLEHSGPPSLPSRVASSSKRM